MKAMRDTILQNFFSTPKINLALTVFIRNHDMNIQISQENVWHVGLGDGSGKKLQAMLLLG